MTESPPVNRYSQPGIYPWGRTLIFVFAIFLIQVIVRGAEYGFTIVATEMDALIAVILSVYLLWLANNLNLKLSHAISLIGLEVLIVMFLNNIAEAVFFTDLYTKPVELAASIGFALLFSVLVTFASAIVYFLPRAEYSLWGNIKNRLSEGSKGGWVLRLVLTGPLFFGVYFLFGLIVSPFVTPFYNDPSLGLKIPAFSVMIPVEILRGYIYGIVLLPLIVSLRFGKLYSFITVSMMLFVLGGLVPLIDAPLPEAIIPYHTLEILGDSLVFGYIVMWLYKAR